MDSTVLGFDVDSFAPHFLQNLLAVEFLAPHCSQYNTSALTAVPDAGPPRFRRRNATTAKNTTRMMITPAKSILVSFSPGIGDAPTGVEDDCVVLFVDTACAADVAFMKLNTDVVFMKLDTDVVFVTVVTDVVGRIVVGLVEVDVNAFVTWSWKLIGELGETTAPFHRTYVLTCSAHEPIVLGAITDSFSVTMNCPFCGD